MKCEFEEKQYESCLNSELTWKGNIYVSGQFLEKTLGIDAALVSKNKKFWNLWDKRKFPLTIFPNWRQGISLDSTLWDDVENRLNSETFPKIKCNIFLQHKRPEFIKSNRGSEFFFWKEPYYRYNLTSHQHKILTALEGRVKSEAIVAYSCPAFWRNCDLFNYQENGEITENSNFVEPQKIGNHNRFTFINAGLDGYAFSEPSRIPTMNFFQEIDRRSDNNIPYSNSELIYLLSDEIKNVLSQDESYRIIFQKIIGELESYHKLVQSIYFIFSFSVFSNLTWSFGIENESDKIKENLSEELSEELSHEDIYQSYFQGLYEEKVVPLRIRT